MKEKHVKMKSGRKQGYIGHMCKWVKQFSTLYLKRNVSWLKVQYSNCKVATVLPTLYPSQPVGKNLNS